MKSGIRIIDLEHHFATEGLTAKLYGPNWLDGASKAGASSEVLDMAKAELGDADQFVARMDVAGIDFSQLSLVTPGSEIYEAQENKALAIEANDRIASFIAKYPNRIGGFMALVPHDVEWSLKEFDRCANMGQPKPEFGSIAHEPSYYLKHNLYGNTSGNYDTNVFRFSAFKLGIDRLVLGTDDPCESAEGTKRSVNMILEDEVFTLEQKKKMLQDNAEALGFGVSHLE